MEIYSIALFYFVLWFIIYVATHVEPWIEEIKHKLYLHNLNVWYKHHKGDKS